MIFNSYFGLIYIVINFSIYVRIWNTYNYSGADTWICTARGAAGLIYFNLAISLLSMMRVTISRLKYYRISKWLRLDSNNYIHQITGHGMLFGVLLHAIAYAMKPNYKFWSNLTGCIMFIITIIVWILSQKRIRKSRYFELFYYSHYLNLITMILLYYHVSKINYWMIIPIICYACDRFYRFYCTFYPTQLADSVMWSENILELKIFRPRGFNYVCGDYMFICIPDISKFQWHPFSISSDPHDTHLLTVHLRTSGDWTQKVNKLCTQVKQNHNGYINKFQPLVYLDGPLSAPASYMSKEQNIILVAQGIGATPFISYLKFMITNNDLTKNVTLLWFSHDKKTYNFCENDPCLKELFLEHTKYSNLKICFCDPLANNLIDEFNKIKNSNYSILHTVFVCASQKFSDEAKNITEEFKWNFKSEYF